MLIHLNSSAPEANASDVYRVYRVLSFVLCLIRVCVTKHAMQAAHLDWRQLMQIHSLARSDSYRGSNSCRRGWKHRSWKQLIPPSQKPRRPEVICISSLAGVRLIHCLYTSMASGLTTRLTSGQTTGLTNKADIGVSPAQSINSGIYKKECIWKQVVGYKAPDYSNGQQLKPRCNLELPLHLNSSAPEMKHF